MTQRVETDTKSLHRLPSKYPSFNEINYGSQPALSYGDRTFEI